MLLGYLSIATQFTADPLRLHRCVTANDMPTRLSSGSNESVQHHQFMIAAQCMQQTGL